MIQRILGPGFVGTYAAEASDPAEQVRVSLGLRSEVVAVVVLELTQALRSVDGFRDAILSAANRAEASRVLNELALAGELDEGRRSPQPQVRPPLPGPTAPPLEIRTPAEQANALARYINAGGLDHVEAPGLRWARSHNTFLSLAFTDRGQIAAVEVDQDWLYAVTIDRLNKALKEAVTA